ncbi:MAG: BrnT family toxin [Gammaproteobacteria bacterium]|nr:BrnT family toxin [Gammaproteobacteria bacterium]
MRCRGWKTCESPRTLLEACAWPTSSNGTRPRQPAWEKHVVSFEEGASVFDDPLRLDELDSEHSTPEETRYLAVGISSQNNLIVVVH